jgi:hypothetical protein
MSQVEYFEKTARDRATEEKIIYAFPFSRALMKVNTERVRKNIVGTSTSIRGTWVWRKGIPIRSTPPKNPVGTSQRVLPI